MMVYDSLITPQTIHSFPEAVLVLSALCTIHALYDMHESLFQDFK